MAKRKTQKRKTGKKESINVIINRAWEAYKKTWAAFVIALLFMTLIEGALVIIAILPIISVIIGMAASGITGPEMFSSILANWESLAASLTFAGVMFTVTLLVAMVLQGGFTAMTVEALKKKKTSYKTMFSAGRKQWKGFIGVGLVKTVIVLLVMAVFFFPAIMAMISGDTAAAMVTLAVGVLLMIIILLILSVLLAFIYLAVFVKKLGAVDATRESFRFGWNNFWITLGIIIIFAVLSSIVGLLDIFTYVLGTLIVTFVIVPIQLLSLTALYLGRKKGRR